MVTTAWTVVPVLTLSGSVSNPSVSSSESSSMSSCSAVKMKDFSVSPLAKSTLAGTPE